MKTNIYLISFFLSGLFTFNSCEMVPNSEPLNLNPTDTTAKPADTAINSAYPTLFYKLDSSTLYQLRAETPYYLDDYGLFTRKGLINWGYSTIQTSDEIVQIAKRTLVQNPKFSNIFSDSLLSVKSVKQYNSIGNYTGWAVIFNNQIYQGLEVLNTEILVMVSDTINSIGGHHFKDIFIPSSGLMPIDSIKEKVIDKTIVYYNYGGEPIERTITQNSFSNNFVQKIYFIDKGDFLEFHVVWELPVLFSDDSDWIGWYIYLDVLNGEWLTYTDKFVSK